MTQIIGISVGSVAVLSFLTVFGLWLSRLLRNSPDQDPDVLEMTTRPPSDTYGNVLEASEQTSGLSVVNNPHFEQRNSNDSDCSIRSFEIENENAQAEPEPVAYGVNIIDQPRGKSIKF